MKQREIKFRAWDTACNGYADNFSIYYNGSVSIDSTWATNDVIIEQFTGLQDKNGTDIYEGDRLECHMEWEDEPRIELSFVKYNNGCFWFTDDYPQMSFDSSDVKIIGNIHENPELL